MNKRYNIAVLIDWISSPYHIELLAGLEEASQKKNVTIITFIGGSLNSPKTYQSQSNYMYDLITHDYIDGIIVESGILGLYSSKEDIGLFLSKYRPIPVVSISAILDNIPSIVIENSKGLENIILHLIKKHNCKTIAFISGPPANTDSQERLMTYKQTLGNNHINLNPGLILPGTFVRTSGIQAVATLLDERRIVPDAIVCANDDMALGVIEELAKRNIRVPEDIAVVGFDDQEDSKYNNPPLTTVKRPTFKIGENAINIIVQCLQDREVKKITTLAAEPVIRESCGCSCDEGIMQVKTHGPANLLYSSNINRRPNNSPVSQNKQSTMQVLDVFRGLGYMRDNNGIKDFLQFAFPGMGIEDCFYAVFTNNNITKAELLLSYSSNRECSAMKNRETHLLKELIKNKLCEKDGPYAYRLLSLVYDTTILGILGYQSCREHTMLESTLRTSFLINIMTSLSLHHILHK